MFHVKTTLPSAKRRINYKAVGLYVKSYTRIHVLAIYISYIPILRDNSMSER